MSNIVGTFNGLSISYRPNTSDEYQVRADISPMFVAEYTPSEDHTIMDIGAHIGTFALEATRKVPRGKIFAVEPCLESFQLLETNIRLNGLDSIIAASNVAISDKRRRARLSYYPKHPIFGEQNWGNTLTQVFPYGEMVDTTTLPEFFEEKQIAHCDYMKLNCEGSEFDILLSTPADYLRRTNIYLVLYHSDLNKNHNGEELLELFRRSGFNVKIKNEEDNRGWIIAQRT